MPNKSLQGAVSFRHNNQRSFYPYAIVYHAYSTCNEYLDKIAPRYYQSLQINTTSGPDTLAVRDEQH